jgi:hypothetical protein
MLRTRAAQVSLWQALLPAEVLRLPEELARVDALPLTGGAGSALARNRHAGHTEVVQGVLDALLAVTTVSGNGAGYSAGAGDDPLNRRDQLRSVGRVAPQQAVVDHYAVAVVDDLGLIAELDRYRNFTNIIRRSIGIDGRPTRESKNGTNGAKNTGSTRPRPGKIDHFGPRISLNQLPQPTPRRPNAVHHRDNRHDFFRSK